MGPVDTLYEGGLFVCDLKVPMDFPNFPPKLKFTGAIPFHPNVYKDGRVCISILHPPGDDGAEKAEERWRPILGIEQILVSVISMLSDPNCDSPANVDAAFLWRTDRKTFKRQARRSAQKSLEA